MKSIAEQRVLAALLAISGAFFGLLVWMAPPFWFGYVVWGGWIAIALGQKRWQEKWFWIVSAIWNLFVLLLLISDTDWGIPMDNLSYWHARTHSALSFILSVYLTVRVPWNTWPENRKAQN